MFEDRYRDKNASFKKIYTNLYIAFEHDVQCTPCDLKPEIVIKQITKLENLMRMLMINTSL